MLNLNDLHYFVSAVTHGGFAAASRQLGIPKSTLSKRVAELEQALGAQLIYRSSRSFALTDVGHAFHRHAHAALIEAEAAQDVVLQRFAEPRGTVRMTASVPTAQHYLAPALPAFALAHPGIGLQLDVSDRYVDIVQEGIDIAVRSHFDPLPDSGLIQRTVAWEDIVLVAAPGYLAGAAALETPADLAEHDGLLTAATATTWRLTDARGGVATAAPRPRMTANESTVLIQLAMAGVGIAKLPAAMCAAALHAGQLQRVLPQWTAGRVATTLVMPQRRGQLPAVRAVVEFLAACLGGV